LDDATLKRRATSFGPRADLYDRVRPGYPAEAVAWLAGPTPARVLDLGAGTGKLTRGLVAAGHEVVAVEPDRQMRAAFAVRLPEVEALDGSAEALPLGDASIDAVVAGQAFHWFDPDRAFPEIARVLRPGGVLGVVWNVRDESVPWILEFGRIVNGGDGTTDLPDEDEDFGPLFGPVERREFRHATSLNADEVVDLAASRSHTITLPEGERRQLLAGITDLAARETRRVRDGRLRMAYVTVCLRATRR